MAQTKAELLFCPAGVGKHVDHLITRELGRGHPENVVMYSDFPYDLAAGPDERQLSTMGFVPWTWDTGLDAKPGRIRQYPTQADALFPQRRDSTETGDLLCAWKPVIRQAIPPETRGSMKSLEVSPT